MPEIRLQDVEVSEVSTKSWVWRNRIPQNRVTIINGDWGTGKTTSLCSIIADIFNGEEFPDGEVAECEPGHVIFITTETDSEELGEKLLAQGMSKEDIETYIHVADYLVQDNGELGMMDFDRDFPAFMQLFKKVKPWIVVWDPLLEFHSRKEIDSKSIRGLMVKLNQVCAENRITMIGMIHWNKNDKQGRKYRMAGSQQYAAGVKAVITVYEDEKNHKLRHFFQEKHNLGPEPPSIGFTIDDDGAIVWGKVEGQEKATLKIEEAKQWILDNCKDAKPVQQCIKESGFNERTLKRARSLLGKQVLTKEIFYGNKTQAHWEVVGEKNLWGAIKISMDAPGVS